MKKILFPTDFSAASLNAFVYALALARKFSAEIITLHVYDPSIAVPFEYGAILVYYGADDDWNNFENYKDEVPKFRQIAEENNAGDVPLSHVLERGIVPDTILEVARRDDVDYIVMGTKGSGGIKQVLIGTVAEKVMNSAETIVIAVPENCRFKPVSKILFLTQFKNRHMKILTRLVEFAKNFDAHIDALWVTSDTGLDRDSILEDWKQKFAGDDVSFSILACRNVEATIFDYTEAHQIDMVAMTVKQKGFLEKLFLFSVARTMAFHTKIPLLALKNE